MVATVTVILCMVAVLTGFAFMKLGENGSETPEYEITGVSKNGIPAGYAGTVVFETFDESGRESVYRFSFDVSTDDGRIVRSITIFVDSTSDEPRDYYETGEIGVWSDGNGTLLKISEDGEIVGIEVGIGEFRVTAHRN